MPLNHIHNNRVKLGALSGTFTEVDSGLIGISRTGKTKFWSTGFSGCVGVVMSGSGNWGVLAHLNQAIQFGERDLAFALSTLKEFVSKKVFAETTDVLIYYGDENTEQKLTESEIRELMGCERVIDLRKTGESYGFGCDFVYDPGEKAVYTVSSGTALEASKLWNSEPLKPIKNAFTYEEGARKKLEPGLGHKGWFFVD